MNEKLISGYTAYTTADEYGAGVVGDAPGTTPLAVTVSLISATAGGGLIGSILHHC